MLADILEGLPSRPHEISYLAANGHKHYEYNARALTQITRERAGTIEYMAEAKVDNGQEFDNLLANLGSTMNCIGTVNQPRPVLAKPKQELIGNDKVKVIGLRMLSSCRQSWTEATIPSCS